ncbi:MAG: hypothetical protein JXQ65_08650 [Candidatus Marinimicrobia bacterium]|nr:hypothetical protein [Candidatus Neomarinimicrobiota bacterium]
MINIKNNKNQKMARLLAGITGFYTLGQAAKLGGMISPSDNYTLSLVESLTDMEKKQSLSIFCPKKNPLNLQDLDWNFPEDNSLIFEFKNTEIGVYIAINEFPGHDIKIYLEMLVGVVLWKLDYFGPHQIHHINTIGAA